MAGSKNNLEMTPAAQRTIARCRRLAAESARQDSWVAYLVLTLLLDESLASACLIRFGITREWLITGKLGSEVARSAAMHDQVDPAVSLGDGCESAIHPLDAINDPLDFRRVLDRATEIARRGLSEGGVSSANLLLAILETSDFVRERFAAVGVTTDRIRDELLPGENFTEPPLRVDEELVFSLYTLDADSSADRDLTVNVVLNESDVVWRVVDANLNRAREGLRVLEDLARFVANDDDTSLELKSLRHELVEAERCLILHAGLAADSRDSLRHRNTAGDVGTPLSTSSERFRASLSDVIVANSRRIQESLRSLEEFGKLLSEAFAATMKQLRYRAYTVEKSLAFGTAVSGTGGKSSAVQDLTASEPAIAPSSGESDSFSPTSFQEKKGLRETAEHAATSPTPCFNKSERSKPVRIAIERRTIEGHGNAGVHRLQSATVYVLITESTCRLPWQQVVEQALYGGADVLQLREKFLNDRELLRRSVWIRDACRMAGALFITNDRPDIARASDADGVHVGQVEFSVEEARRVLRSEQLVGVSTHDLGQAQQAVSDAADYIGAGPVFRSQTKTFDAFPGLAFVRSASRSIRKPWFAIGGVTLDNLDLLISAGASRVAVTSAVASSSDPVAVVQEFKRRLRNDQP